MELKKNPKYDLIKKERMFRNMDLTISLLAVIVVFEIPSKSDGEIIDGYFSSERYRFWQ